MKIEIYDLETYHEPTRKFLQSAIYTLTNVRKCMQGIEAPEKVFFDPMAAALVTFELLSDGSHRTTISSKPDPGKDLSAQADQIIDDLQSKFHRAMYLPKRDTGITPSKVPANTTPPIYNLKEQL